MGRQNSFPTLKGKIYFKIMNLDKSKIEFLVPSLKNKVWDIYVFSSKILSI